MEQEVVGDELPQVFFRPIVETEDGLVDLGVPDEVVQKTLQYIVRKLQWALEHSEEAEQSGIDSEADES